MLAGDISLQAWLEAHLQQPWSSSAAANQLTPEMLEQLPTVFPDLAPNVRQAVLLMALHAPKRVCAASTAALSALAEAAAADEEESVRVLAALARALAADDGRLAPDAALEAMGAEVREVLDELLEVARRERVREPASWPFLSPAAPAVPTAAAPAAAPGAPADTQRGFRLRQGYLDPVVKQRAAAAAATNGPSSAKLATGAGRPSSGAAPPLTAPSGARPGAAGAGRGAAAAGPPGGASSTNAARAAAAIAAAKARAAASAEAAKAAKSSAANGGEAKKRSMLLLDDDESDALLQQRTQQPGAKGGRGAGRGQAGAGKRARS